MFFKDAIEKDPDFALPYAALAETYTIQSIGFAVLPSREAMPKAKENADKALTLDPGLAEAHLARALVSMYYEWDYASAKSGFEKALALNPNFTMAHSWFEFYWTYIRHNYAEAIAACERAKKLDPLQLDIMDRSATVNLLFGYFDEGLEQLQRILDLEPTYAVAYLGLADAYQRMGNSDAAVSAAKKAVELGGEAVAFLGLLGIAYGVRGDDARAREILTELLARSRQGYVSSFWLAVVHAALGEIDASFDAFERAREERDANLLYVTFVPRVLGVHDHPRFEKLVESIRLEHLLPLKDTS